LKVDKLPSMIRFGTDGWRAIIAQEFTFDNLALVAQAHAQAIRQSGGRKVCIGFDGRFASEAFAVHVAQVMLANGLEVLVSAEVVPTPALSLAVVRLNADAGVMITASHNPSAYNGYKIKGSYGGSATPEMVALVEAQLLHLEPKAFDTTLNVACFDAKTMYFEHILGLLDIKALKSYSGQWFFDAMGGAGAGWLGDFIEFAELPVQLIPIRHPVHPLFYGANPEPIEPNLSPLAFALKDIADPIFGVATDGDADRVGAMLAGGTFFNSHQIFAVLLAHLARKGLHGRVIKTVSTSSLIERLAKHLNFEYLETPIGFKYITSEFLKPGTPVLIGGEESGGLTVLGHIPERDGLLNSLLLLESVVMSGLSLRAQFQQIEQTLNLKHAYDRIDLHLEKPLDHQTFLQTLSTLPQVGKWAVESVNTIDGVKLLLEGSAWLMFRLSGTEPLLRVYCEAQTEQTVEELLAAAQELIEKLA
jgi:phosphomannomutase